MEQKSIPNQLIDTIREHSDIFTIVSEHVALKKTGQNYTGLCPFHEEKTASFVVNPVKQFFHCFGCGAGGDVFHFVSKMEGTPFPETLRSLAERGGIPLPDAHLQASSARSGSEAEDIYRVNEAAAVYFHHKLMDSQEASVARSYLKARGISDEAMRQFSIGYASSGWDHLLKTLGKQFPTSLLEKAGLISRRGSSTDRSQRDAKYFDRFRNRVLFPIHTLRAKVAGFGGRVLDESTPKYLNTAETSVFTKGQILYGLHQAKGGGQHPLVIVEGYLDVIAAVQAGIPNVVATLGTALTEGHLRLIRRLSDQIFLVFDGDDAGIRAALRTVPLLIDSQIQAKAVTLPAGKDPDVFIRSLGKAAFLETLEKSKTVIDFSITQWIKKSVLNTVEDKLAVIRKIVPLISRLKSQVEKSHYLNLLSDRLHLTEKDVCRDYIRQIKNDKPQASKPFGQTKSLKVERLPDEEKSILTLLIQDYLNPTELNDQLHPDDFSHPMLKKLIACYWDVDTCEWHSPKAHFRMEDEASQSLLARLSVDKVDTEEIKTNKEDCIRMLQKKRIDRERNKIVVQLKQASGNKEAADIIKQKLMDLSTELKKLEEKKRDLITLSH